MHFHAKGRVIDTANRRPLVMGIVNITDDSFSGDGSLSLNDALSRARNLLAGGADIIDVGAESARANRGPIPAEEETARLLPFVEAFPALVEDFSSPPFDAAQLWPPLLSINTWRPAVAEAVLPAGGDILNDIGTRPEEGNAACCARHGAALVVMHGVGSPKEPHLDEAYRDILEALEAFFADKIRLAEAAGLSREQIILDPGIDFAKQRDDNLRIYRDLARLQQFDRPLLLPVSRKTVVGEVLGIDEAADRDAGTVACAVSGALRGASIFRVHNVSATVHSLKVLAPLI